MGDVFSATHLSELARCDKEAPVPQGYSYNNSYNYILKMIAICFAFWSAFLLGERGRVYT